MFLLLLSGQPRPARQIKISRTEKLDRYPAVVRRRDGGTGLSSGVGR